MVRKLAASLAVLVLFTLSGSLVAAAQSSGQTYVLVHGAFQDASVWDAVIAQLEADGNSAVAVEFPGRGEDTTPAAELTLESYRDAVIDVVNQQDGPVVLVGHSFGGLVISEVAEAIPDQIERLVYVAAYLPRSGESVLSLSASEPDAQQGGFVVSDDGTMVSVPAEAFPYVFCTDCTSEQAQVVAASQLDEPIAPLSGMATVTDANFGSVPKTYIMTAFDRAVSPTLQMMMIADTPVDQVFALKTGHVPYVTQPEALAALIEQSGASM